VINLWRSLLAGVLTALVMAGLSALYRRAKPLALSTQSGMIRPDRWSAWITIACGMAIMIAGVLVVTVGPKPPNMAVLWVTALFGGLLVGFMAPSVTSVHAVRWNELGIDGPCTTFGLTLGTQRTLLRWEQIVRSGKTATGYWYVESLDGRRVYWSFLYPGYGALVQALRKHCVNAVQVDDLS
jgi:hypothetical protein